MFEPTTMSWLPKANIRPWVIRTLGRSSRPLADVPRTVTLPIEFEPRLSRLMIRSSSRVSNGRPSAAGATSGAVSRISAVGRSTWLVNLDKRGSNSMGNVTVRGTSAKGLELRPNVRITQGRMFAFGSHDIVVGSNIAKRFQAVALGAPSPSGPHNYPTLAYFAPSVSRFASH